jgi:hypothetical protein
VTVGCVYCNSLGSTNVTVACMTVESEAKTATCMTGEIVNEMKVIDEITM